MTDTHDDLFQANAANWDARTPVHVSSKFYSLATRDPEEWFAPYEWDDLGDLAERDIVHLQCHIGSETRAFPGRGARTVGLDLSGAAVAAAREAAPEIEYVHGNVYDAVSLLGAERFDIAYTGKGSLVYLPDLDRWAAEVAALLKPGGFLYLVEFHPMLYTLGIVPSGDEELKVRADYLSGRGPQRMDSPYTYTDGPLITEDTVSYEVAHDLGEVVTAVAGAGLRVEVLRESPDIPWRRWEGMTSADGVWWRLPADGPRVPLLYALRARKPAAGE